MEKKHKKPEEMEDIQRGGFQGGTQDQAGEQFGHKRVRSLSEELPGMDAMLSDPGEPHKDITQQSSRRPEQKGKDSGQQHKPEESPPGWQEHALLGDETVSMQNEKEERERRRVEAERISEASSKKKKKPAA